MNPTALRPLDARTTTDTWDRVCNNSMIDNSRSARIRK
jgi:hypothetical protein